MNLKKVTALLLALLLVLAFPVSPALAAEVEQAHIEGGSCEEAESPALEEPVYEVEDDTSPVDGKTPDTGTADEGEGGGGDAVIVEAPDIPAVQSSQDCGIGACTCTGSCYEVYGDYEYYSESLHTMSVICSGCGAWAIHGGSESHTFSGNTCTKCGYSKACSHSSTKREWTTSCRWADVCKSCGETISSGTSHGPYDYGSWSYYNATQHRRSYTCTYGDSGTWYETANHSTTKTYTEHSATQHAVSSYCSTCGSTVGSTSYASHSFTYGSWERYSATQHRRMKSCSVCGYSEYVYASHGFTYGSWENTSATQHRRLKTCSTCGDSGYEYSAHSYSYGSWASISETQHNRTGACVCGRQDTQQEPHSFAYGPWSAASEDLHERTGTCACGHLSTQQADHADTDDDGYCDACTYLMTRFSVTVPASLSMTVSQHGAVHAATDAAIVNNSTGPVRVTALTVTAENGWTLAPYDTNMATAKVDTKQIGFALNEAKTTGSGYTEPLGLGGDWTITKGGRLHLLYDAVVSAMSAPVNEQVLTLVFVLDWAE